MLLSNYRRRKKKQTNKIHFVLLLKSNQKRGLKEKKIKQIETHFNNSIKSFFTKECAK